MARQTERLTELACETAKDGTHSDGNGLVLRVAKDGTRKSWALRVMVDGKAKWLGLGGYPKVSLLEARNSAAWKRAELRGQTPPPPPMPTVPSGLVIPGVGVIPNYHVIENPAGDPFAALDRIKPVTTFRWCAEQTIAVRKGGWKATRTGADPLTLKRWERTLKKYVYPVIGDKPIDQIHSADILAVLTPIWTEKRETAIDAKRYMSRIFKWARVAGHCTNNPADGVEEALPKNRKPVEHHPATAIDDVASMVLRCRESNAKPAVKLALELMIFTGVRGHNVREAEWCDFDLANRTWNLPAIKMKYETQHRVWLTDRCLEILTQARELSDGTGLVFPGQRGQIIHRDTLSKLMKRWGAGATPHGFRSSFRDWAATRTDAPREVAEMAIAHVAGSASELAYRRTDYWEERRELMQRWHDFLIEGIEAALSTG